MTADRSVYVGAHITELTKEGLKEEAEKRGWSVSQTIAYALTWFLERHGYRIEEREQRDSV